MHRFHLHWVWDIPHCSTTLIIQRPDTLLVKAFISPLVDISIWKHKLDPVPITGMKSVPLHYTVILYWTDAELVHFGGPLEMYSQTPEL